jgi:hypothetical protein
VWGSWLQSADMSLLDMRGVQQVDATGVPSSANRLWQMTWQRIKAALIPSHRTPFHASSHAPPPHFGMHPIAPVRAPVCCAFSSFSRPFTLPDNVEEDKITANLHNGVLATTVPKVAPPPKLAPRRIALTTSTPSSAAAAQVTHGHSEGATTH